MKTKSSMLTAFLIVALSIPIFASAQTQNNLSCATQEQMETLSKMEVCFSVTDGANPISTNSFDGAPAMFRQLEFYKCLSQKYQTSKVDPNMEIYWSDIYRITIGYFKYNLSLENGSQKQRCGLAETFNKYVTLGQSR